jgi:hypothetical protein
VFLISHLKGMKTFKKVVPFGEDIKIKPLKTKKK